MADTLAPSYASLSSISACKVAERAPANKGQKYSALSHTQEFQPIPLETLGPFDPSALKFLCQLGKRLVAAPGDCRETSFLFQRISVTLQRLNCIAFTDTFYHDFIDTDDR